MNDRKRFKPGQDKPLPPDLGVTHGDGKPADGPQTFDVPPGTPEPPPPPPPPPPPNVGDQ